MSASVVSARVDQGGRGVVLQQSAYIVGNINASEKMGLKQETHEL